MKYPAVWLMGSTPKGETLSIAFAGEGQHQDLSSKMVHGAPGHLVVVVSKSVARGGGHHFLPRPWFRCGRGAGFKSTVRFRRCWLMTSSRSDTYPYAGCRRFDGLEQAVIQGGRTSCSTLMSRGMTEEGER